MSRYLNISNGNPYQDWSIDELEEHWNEIEPLWDTLVQFMDEETREAVHMEFAPCTEREFLIEYLKRVPQDLIVG